MRIYINPEFKHPERGDGGIRRIVEAQRRWLPRYGIEVVDDAKSADLCAFHAGSWVEPPKNIPVVSHTHGLYWEEYYGWSKGHSHLNKDVIRNLKQADVVTAPSEWVAYALKRGMWLDPVVLYHGIEPDEWPLLEGHDDYVLWNKTRVDPVCDPAPLDELVKRAPDIKFVSTFGAKAPNITLTGNEPYEQAKQRTQRAGVYLATARETFGIGTLEAMAAGVPVLGFDYGGQSEIVVHKQQGYLARPGDYDELAVGLDYCREHREYLGRNAREKVLAQFTWEYWIKQYASLYRDLILECRSRPKVSIVIPYYNLGKYVQEAIDSAKAQIQASNIKGEVILIDDASQESLPASVTDVNVVRHNSNKDLPETLNDGLDRARGEYVLFLDADNRLANLNVLVEALDNDRSLDIAYGRMSVFSETKPGGWISAWPPPEANLVEQLKHKNQIPSTALCRKKVATWVGGYRHRCYTAEDADFWTRTLAVGAKAKRVTDLVTLEYRDRSDSRSHARKDWQWNEWYLWAMGRENLISAGGPIHVHDAPEISVVIPVGPGHENLVIDALDSVQAQSGSFWNWEAVVVNDSGKVLKGVQPWARVVPGDKLVSGASAARNRGLWLSKGEYVLFLDADDYLHPDALYHMYNYYKSCTCEKAFVYSDWFEAETGKLIEVDDFNPVDVLGRLPYPVTCLYNRRDLIKANIKWDESFKDGWEDWDFAIQVVTAGFCGLHLQAPLLHYRFGSGSLRAQAKAHGDELRRKIRFKYADYFKGDKIVPGCGGCGGGRYPSIMANMYATTPFDGVDLDKDTKLVQYNPPPDWTGTRTFVGRGTGSRYRFSLDPTNRVRRVFNADVETLVNLGFFTVLDGAVGTLAPLQAGSNVEPEPSGTPA